MRMAATEHLGFSARGGELNLQGTTKNWILRLNLQGWLKFARRQIDWAVEELGKARG